MINLYAYTYPSAINKFPGFILTKVGDSHRDVETRMNEQRGSAEFEDQIQFGKWNGLTQIKRDFDVHKHLTLRGLHHREGKGTEWFKIPGDTVDDARRYIDDLVTELEGRKVRDRVTLRQVQQKALDRAIDIINGATDSASIIANLCPRFGKTIWSLMLFNRITEQYGNRIMLLPAYWLASHSSFIDELERFDDFQDIVEIDVDRPGAEQMAQDALDTGMRIVIPISLHGDVSDWKRKHKWVAELDRNEIFVFADEGDFGTHTDMQRKRLEFILG